jgi:hypothetical protein
MADNPKTEPSIYRILIPMMALCCTVSIIGLSGLAAFVTWIAGFDFINIALAGALIGSTIFALVRRRGNKNDLPSKIVRDTK